MAAPLTDRQLDEIQAKAERSGVCALCVDDKRCWQCAADRYQLAETDVPAMVAEIRRLRAGLRELAECRDGQEVVCTDGLRIGGESGAIVHNGSFNAVHIEDLGDAIERLLNGTN